MNLNLRSFRISTCVSVRHDKKGKKELFSGLLLLLLVLVVRDLLKVR